MLLKVQKNFLDKTTIKFSIIASLMKNVSSLLLNNDTYLKHSDDDAL